MTHISCDVLDTEVLVATLGADVTVTFPAGYIRPTCEGLPQGEGGVTLSQDRSTVLLGHRTSTYSRVSSLPCLIPLLCGERCLCRFFLQSEQGSRRGAYVSDILAGSAFPSLPFLPYLWSCLV